MTDTEIEERISDIMSKMKPFTKFALASLGSTEIVRDAIRVGYTAGQKDAYADVLPKLETVFGKEQ